MQKWLFLSMLVLFSLGYTFAQSPLKPCGTVGAKSSWLQKYQADPAAFQKNIDTIIYVPLTIHLVGTEGGTGFFKHGDLLDALCTLNEDFETSNIQFYVEGSINYLYSNAWYQHQTILQGGEMMFTNNIENTLNCYFVSDPAGNCGYNLPYAGIAVAKSCAKPTDHTWSHEVGHALSLPHPFLGWEGGVSYDNSVSHNFTDPAPLTVTYDYTYFLDTLILDTLIIDTALVEFVDGSNCSVAADGFCDTSPDYIASRWNCNTNLESPLVQKDPNGVEFRSDATLIMSYANDNCAYRFSDEQIAAMRANLYDEKPDLLYNQTSEELVELTPELFEPIDNELVQYNYVELQWEEVPNASHYVIQVSLLSSFSPSLTKTYISNENAILIDDLADQKKYYWKVRPYNNYHFCTEFSAYQRFETENMVGVKEIDELVSMQVYPTILKPNDKLNVIAFANEAFDGKVKLFNNLGELITEIQYSFSQGSNTFIFEMTKELSAGFYFLTLNVRGKVLMEKLIVGD